MDNESLVLKNGTWMYFRVLPTMIQEFYKEIKEMSNSIPVEV